MTKAESRLHHRRSIRLPGYDYSQPGAYFITICVEDHQCLLSEVIGGAVHLTPTGRIAQQEWERLSVRFAGIRLDAYIIMPNHIHGIIILEDSAAPDTRGTGAKLHDHDSDLPDPSRAPSREQASREQASGEQFGKPIPGSIPTIVRSYKSDVTQWANRMRRTPGAPFWQRNYYEHIIRDQAELECVRDYINDNPEKWERDRVDQDRGLFA